MKDRQSCDSRAVGAVRLYDNVYKGTADIIGV
jgi:hypothetical protein